MGPVHDRFAGRGTCRCLCSMPGCVRCRSGWRVSCTCRGAALARGYHGRADLTAERFVAEPVRAAGERMYRTGDLVRWNAESASRADARVEYVGRTDFQVKLRGQRIELGEIDAVLAAHESVRFAVTLGRTLDSGATVLVSYVQPVAGCGDRYGGVGEVRRGPVAGVHGAVGVRGDRAGAVDPGRASWTVRRCRRRCSRRRSSVRRRTPLEQGIAEVMAEVLGRGVGQCR